MLVAMVPGWALPFYVGQFIGHFSAELAETCTDSEWNQRWQKWVARGWNDSSNRPSKPTDGAPVVDPAETKRKREAAEMHELERVRRRVKTESGVAPSSPEAAKAAMESLMAGGTR